MTIAEQIYQIAQSLPEPLALKALDFVEYLSGRKACCESAIGLTNAQEIVMKHVWDNQDDEVWNDVKTL